MISSVFFVVVVVIIGGFYLNYQNTRLSRSYAEVNSKGTLTITFKGNSFTTTDSIDFDSEEESYRLNGNKLTLKDGSDSETITISSNHKTFTIDGTDLTKN